MIEAITAILEYSQGMGFDQFSAERKTLDAVEISLLSERPLLKCRKKYA